MLRSLRNCGSTTSPKAPATPGAVGHKSLPDLVSLAQLLRALRKDLQPERIFRRKARGCWAFGEVVTFTFQ